MSEHMPHGHLVSRTYQEDSPSVPNKWRYDEHADGTILRYERDDVVGWWPGEHVPWVGY